MELLGYTVNSKHNAMDKNLRDFNRELSQKGLRLLRMTRTGKGHHRAEIADTSGRKLVYVLASSNSDHRAVANRKRDISRFFKEQAQ